MERISPKIDLYRYEQQNARKFGVRLKYFFFTPGYTFTWFFRRASNARTVFGKILFYPFFHLTKIITGIQIPIGTEIGRGLKISHFGTIIVNPRAKIGYNFSISPGCLVGNSKGKNIGYPTIGNNVVMGVNSMIVGKVNIGNNVLIAPGAFVNFDIPDNCIALGNPAKIIQKEESPTAKYIDPAPGTTL